MAFDIDDYRRQAEDFLESLEREYFEHYAGRKEATDFSGIYAAHEGLFSKKTIGDLKAAATGGDPGVQELMRFAIDGFLGLATKELYDRDAEAEAKGTVEVDGETMPYRMSSTIQTNEADRDRRHRIEQARLQFTQDQLNPIAFELYTRFQELSRELGYRDYLELSREMRGADFEALNEQMQQFLSDTEDIYRRRLDSVFREAIGVPLDQAQRSDLPYLFRAPQWDNSFTADRLMSSLHDTLGRLGISLKDQRNIEVDAEVREQKSPRAFCATIRVPTEVKLVVMPVGGQDDYQALFHEAGHAEHFAHVDPDLPLEFRSMGDNGVTEGFAFLFEHLLQDPEWLRTYVDMEDSVPFLRFIGLVQLYFLRRYAGKLAYEMELHREGPSPEMAARYSHHLSQATLVPFPETNYLTDVDEGMYCTNYLRAWIFEANLRSMLKSKFGDKWFLSADAGSFLKGLWRPGQRYRAEELWSRSGGDGMGIGPLTQNVARLINL